VNEKFDNMISILQRDVNELQSLIAQEQPISPDDDTSGDSGNNNGSNSSRPTKKRRRRGVRQDDAADNDSLDNTSDYSNDESEVYDKGVDNQQDEDSACDINKGC